jgi:hypothetical protein
MKRAGTPPSKEKARVNKPPDHVLCRFDGLDFGYSLGFRGCSADHLLDFLHSIECEYLYLVGDIIDIWK